MMNESNAWKIKLCTSTLYEYLKYLHLYILIKMTALSTGVYKKLAIKDKKTSERKKRFLDRQQRMMNMKILAESKPEVNILLSSTDESDSDNSSDDEMLEAENNTVHLRELRKRKRKRKKIVTPELTAALDRTKVSDRSDEGVSYHIRNCQKLRTEH